jgi:hypothetical protein
MWRTDRGTSDVDGFEREDADDADTDVEEEASPADNRSTQNVENRECEDWTVYLGHVKYINSEANTTPSDVSEAKTIEISHKLSEVNINESVVCGYRPKKGIIIARRCVNSYSITAAPVNSVTYVSF